MQAQEPVALRGRVVDAVTRAPLEGAMVQLATTGRDDGPAVRTDAHGVWRLVARVPSGSGAPEAVRVFVRFLGYVPRTVTIDRLVLARGSETEIALSAVPLSLEQVVVTASRRPQRLADSPVPIELVSRADIERTGASDLASVLGEQIGVIPTAGHPSGSGVMLQGLAGERVLVLLDGRPLSGRNSNTFDLSRIPASIVERVEVIKGPQSTLYGSDAMGGVINIITRKPERGAPSFELGAMAGSQGRRDYTAQVEGQLANSLSAVANAGYRSVLLAPGVESSRGAYARRWDGLGTLHWQADNNLLVEASGMVVDEEQRWNEGLYYFGSNRQLDGRLGAVWTPGSMRITPSLHMSEYRHLRQRSTLASAPPTDSGPEIQRLIDGEILFSSAVGASGQHALDGGVQVRRDEIRSFEVRGRQRVTHSVEPYIQGTLGIGPVDIVPGLRLSWSEQWGTHWTPRVATLYRATPQLSFRASFGQGFRTPDFKEMYLSWANPIPGSSYAVHGNPDLEPERSRNLAASVEWSGERVYGRVQGFDNRFRNFIESQLIGDSIPPGSTSGTDHFAIYSYDNVDRGRTRGVDLDAGLSLGQMRVDGGYSYLDTEWLTTGEPLLGRPTHFVRLGVTTPLPFGIRASATGLYTGSAPVARDDAGRTTYQDAFTRLDLRLTRALAFGVELMAGADNLFDAHPTGWPGVAQRHLYMGVRWRVQETGSGR